MWHLPARTSKAIYWHIQRTDTRVVLISSSWSRQESKHAYFPKWRTFETKQHFLCSPSLKAKEKPKIDSSSQILLIIGFLDACGGEDIYYFPRRTGFQKNFISFSFFVHFIILRPLRLVPLGCPNTGKKLSCGCLCVDSYNKYGFICFK